MSDWRSRAVEVNKSEKTASDWRSRAKEIDPDQALFGPGGKIPEWFNESPNAKGLMQGTLEQGPVVGAMVGAPVGFAAGSGVASIPMAAAGAGLGGSIGKGLENIGKHYLLGENLTPERQAKEVLLEIPEQASGQVLGTAAAKGLEKIATSAPVKWAGKKLMTTFLGPNDKAISAYMANPKAVENAKSVEEIKDIVDDQVGKLRDAVSKSELSHSEAKEALKEVNNQIRAHVSDAKFQFANERANINEALASAKNSFEKELTSKVDALKNIKSPIQISDDVMAAMQDLKSQIKRGSEESYAILDKDPKAYSVRNAGKLLRQMADEMNIESYANPMTPKPGGVYKTGYAGQKPPPMPGQAPSSPPVTSESEGVQNALRSFAQRLENTPEIVPARELKKMLQQIDNSERALYGQVGFDSRVSQAYKTIRATISDVIKENNPAYRDKMLEVAGKTSLFSELEGTFSNPANTVSRLNRISSRTSQADRDLLTKLQNETGVELMTPINEHLAAKTALENKNQLAQSIPTGKTIEELESQAIKMRRPDTSKEFVKQSLGDSGLLNDQRKAVESIKESRGQLTKAKEALDPFSKITQDSSQAKINNLLRNPGVENIETRRAFDELSKLSDNDFVRMIDELRAKKAFSGQITNGSRNAVMFGSLGAALGAAAGGGGTGLTSGATAGAMFGGVVDKFGPKMAKKILSTLSKFDNGVTLQKIRGSGLPPEVVSFLSANLSGQKRNNLSGPGSDQGLINQDLQGPGGR